ncbi:MAG: apolipoprotein N-acyltransferase [Trichloromonadaceae bacterium]
MSLPRPDRSTLIALGSGLLLALAFPRLNLAPLAWVALVPMVLVMERHPFRSGFAAGVGFFGLVLYWLNIVMTTYGQMHPVFSLAAYLMLVIYLALFFGAATWAACRLREHLGWSIILTLPVFWVGFEFVRSFLFSGFPWASLGYSQISLLPLVQSADLTGVYGISFLLVLSNAALAQLIIARRGRQPLPWLGLGLTLLLFAANAGYGLLRLQQDLDSREQTAKVGLVQGNIDQAVKWDPGYQQATVERYGELSRQLVAESAVDLIIWPESATPFYFQEGGPLATQVSSVAGDTGTELLFGSPAYEVVTRRPRYLNSAFMLSAQGEVLGRSDKIHLVPFGEYVPLGRYLPFINKLVVGIGDFSPGTVNPLPLGQNLVGVLVCFEGIFPELARDYVREGSQLLINITNDAWFGRSSAPAQHLAMTRFRALENRIWVARAANTGISALIAPSGRLTLETPIFETLAVSGTVGLGAQPTIYTRFGDLLPIFCLLLGLVGLVMTRRRYGRS